MHPLLVSRSFVDCAANVHDQNMHNPITQNTISNQYKQEKANKEMPNPTTIKLLALFFAISSATVDHSTPRDQLRKRHPANPLPPPARFVPILDLEQLEFLNAHNLLRLRAGVPPLLWDPILTSEAHAWAEQRRGDCDYRHHSPNRFGENIFWMRYREFTPRDIVQWWFDERRFYDHAKNACTCRPERAGCECGHYLNVVWSTTRRVGCSGAVYCDNQKGVYVVCQYDPAGLIPGVNPFTGAKLSA